MNDHAWYPSSIQTNAGTGNVGRLHSPGQQYSANWQDIVCRSRITTMKGINRLCTAVPSLHDSQTTVQFKPQEPVRQPNSMQYPSQ